MAIPTQSEDFVHVIIITTKIVANVVVEDII